MIEATKYHNTRIDQYLHKILRLIIILVTTICCFTMLAQVISRYVFETAISGLDELTGHSAVWLYLMGAAYASYEGSQIKAEMVHLFIKNERALSIIRAVASTVGCIVTLYMVSWSYTYVVWSINKHEVTPTLQIPTIYFQIPILIGAVIMCFYSIRETSRNYLALVSAPSKLGSRVRSKQCQPF